MASDGTCRAREWVTTPWCRRPPIADYLPDFAVNRHYQLYTTPGLKPAIFLQGSCEPTHGLSDILLSILAARTSEICDALDQTTALSTASTCKQEVPTP
ncbi:hypothetical protein [Halomonas sp. AOP42-C2-25]|uniref:hypothetical protein n=1 Tax=Halomonas sp. AOP42-C2-25 TaxID=3457668 RepID=UPI00403466A9